MDIQFLSAQLFNGLMLGSFYILLSLGLSIIFGMLGVVNFAHGALYMLGAYAGYTVCNIFGQNFWLALIIGPLAVGIIGMVLETTLIRRLYSVPHFYNLLLTFGIMLAVEELIRMIFTPIGKPFDTPPAFVGSLDLGFIVFPKYRMFIIFVTAICSGIIALFIAKTKLGAIVRAGTDDSEMTSALGINISRVFTLVFGLGAALAGLAGVLAAPVQNVIPDMGSNILVETFVVVIIGGMGSILGSILGGLIVGELITLGVVFWPPVANVVIFVFMAIILLMRPRGLFGRAKFFE
jgi:branched-chain amino acid transport system permease protein